MRIGSSNLSTPSHANEKASAEIQRLFCICYVHITLFCFINILKINEIVAWLTKEKKDCAVYCFSGIVWAFQISPLGVFMPHLRFRAVEFDVVKVLSAALVDDLQPLMACPREDFTLEHIPASFIFDGEVSDAYPFVEVLWFDRGQVIQDQVANIITLAIRSALQDNDQDVAVIFSSLTPSAYYDNGEHY